MKRSEFMDKVVEIYFRGNFTVQQSLDKVKEELSITNTEFIDMFGKNKEESNEN